MTSNIGFIAQNNLIKPFYPFLAKKDKNGNVLRRHCDKCEELGEVNDFHNQVDSSGNRRTSTDINNNKKWDVCSKCYPFTTKYNNRYGLIFEENIVLIVTNNKLKVYFQKPRAEYTKETYDFIDDPIHIQNEKAGLIELIFGVNEMDIIKNIILLDDPMLYKDGFTISKFTKSGFDLSKTYVNIDENVLFFSGFPFEFTPSSKGYRVIISGVRESIKGLELMKKNLGAESTKINFKVISSIIRYNDGVSVSAAEEKYINSLLERNLLSTSLLTHLPKYGTNEYHLLRKLYPN